MREKGQVKDDPAGFGLSTGRTKKPFSEPGIYLVKCTVGWYF